MVGIYYGTDFNYKDWNDQKACKKFQKLQKLLCKYLKKFNVIKIVTVVNV